MPTFIFNIIFGAFNGKLIHLLSDLFISLFTLDVGSCGPPHVLR